MKFTALALLGLVSLATAKDGDDNHLQQHLRATTSNTNSNEALTLTFNSNSNGSSCYPIKSKDECKSTTDTDSDTPCVWCECAAVPPVCVSSEESKGLPPGVFDCGDASSPDNFYDFGLESGTVLQLRKTVIESGSETASDFCDASSKSISGYMDLKGSKVCIVLYCIVF